MELQILERCFDLLLKHKDKTGLEVLSNLKTQNGQTKQRIGSDNEV